MQAAFVDINLEKAAFLYVSDVQQPVSDLEQLFMNSCEITNEGEKADDDAEPASEELKEVIDLHPSYSDVPIQDRLQEGQEILVQVAKEPIGHKGARITTHITLPGRLLVLMPTMDHVGVSRRIENEKERKRLRDLMCVIKPPGCGFIVQNSGGRRRVREARSGG